MEPRFPKLLSTIIDILEACIGGWLYGDVKRPRFVMPLDVGNNTPHQ